SFTEPISTPFTKNLCKNGYIINSGNAETIITAYLTNAAVLTCSEKDFAAPAIDDALSALTSLRIKICLNIICNRNKSSSQIYIHKTTLIYKLISHKSYINDDSYNSNGIV